MNDMLHTKKLFKDMMIWECVLFIPSLLLMSYLPLNNLLDMFINVIILILSVIGIFAIRTYIKNQRTNCTDK
ncbi:cell division protein FtsW (lipid II flippase) [Priestia megaterium]|nr:cell division protein FtsW (lipid II flippase) [Priestia megaterium]